ncbi:hypothetical protein R70723_02790 [Paenibacillus sp. FSL R7-0273]|uniref:hypothetical protein n=1 Tax=Paenibacillus sp. FSL R7-0273 TaxID=1536772 RepID=UPI0004F64674|nr:hypothetical protein [Paenibacillus sp. FSL R7-0273]AIQ44952.1 hypothetical protein R70723_02790 [Paenibacillus sp. FSL R7-0273]OMF85833.1 hypothetical protein BK144_27260 [Paenibacillus sp. FSL R7-0273]
MEDHDLERKLSEMLSEMLQEGEMEQGDRTAKEVRQISPKYEIRIQTTHDPIVEETLRYRKIASELDDRYDKYLKRAGFGDQLQPDKGDSPAGGPRSGP